jgi:hypothetical protein
MKQSVAKHGRAEEWTRERIGQLPAPEIMQLRANAERLNEPVLAALCGDVLAQARSRARAELRGNAGPQAKARKLVARAKAFEARGVRLQDVRTSWGGVRGSDGAIVMALWAEAIESVDGTCRYLLWAANTAGTRPWSDTPGGRERLEHCKRAVELRGAEGLLVYGQRLEGRLPEDKASAIYGADPEAVLRFEVEARDQEYWAVWGGKAAESSAVQPPS